MRASSAQTALIGFLVSLISLTILWAKPFLEGSLGGSLNLYPVF
jgi:hypothetical protein